MTRRANVWIMLVAIGLVCLSSLSIAAVPQVINYQGILKNASGTPVNGDVTMRFSLYSSLTGTASLWTELQSKVSVTNGRYGVVLGSVMPLALSFDTQYYLGMAVNTDPEMTPRKALTAAPYAFRAGCNPGDMMACYTGAPGTFGVGLCKAGSRSCNTDGSGFGLCVGEVLPTTEICGDGKDNDCDGQVDEGCCTPVSWYQDADGDGYGNPSVTMQACTKPAGYVSNNADCNDTNNAIHPGVAEVCDGIDNNCNGQIDEGVRSTYYRDLDGDGYGNLSVTIQACSQPGGYVSNSNDCNDTNAAIHPGAPEVNNGVDDNCDGQIDESAMRSWYKDMDGDGFGTDLDIIYSDTRPPGYALNNLDCDDSNANIYPGHTEICGDLIDNNCDGQVDEGC